jgi:3-dehydroquinate synthase
MRKLQVSLGDRSYPVYVGDGALAHAGSLCRRLGFGTAPLVVSNARVMRLHGARLLTSLESAFGPVRVIRIGDGERFKSQETLTRIYEEMIRSGADRRSWLVAFGGGVVGDIAGFAAATFMRGIPFVGVPTTLLAQVDSSVGGKVGINIPQGKNLIGAFHHPKAVISDTSTLQTLPSREMASGLYEVVKCAAIRSGNLLDYLERRMARILAFDSRSLSRIILEAVRLKAEIVAADEKECHLRMILNFGHTLGHALETAGGYRRFRHGEAVAWGMILASAWAVDTGKLVSSEAGRLIRILHRIEKLPPIHGLSPAVVWRAMQRDKKSLEGRMQLVLLPRLGEAEVVCCPDRGRWKDFVFDFVKQGGKITRVAER